MKKEYYIQGNPARAEEIKAAFEAKGIDTTCHSVTHDDYLYYSSDGFLYFEEFSNTLLNIFKTHPDYKELELPVEHKFKVHEWVVDNGQPAIIYELKKNYYLGKYLNGHDFCHKYADEDKLHLWSIADAKDGDVLALNGKPFIYSHKYGKNYCYIDDCGQFRVNFSLVLEGNCVCPATKQERDLLFSKMRKVGYEWDGEKKELRKIIKQKFNVGDWAVTDYGKVSQVVSVDKDGDGYTLDDGVYFSGSWCDMYHHWTIQDVKDGDVLTDDKMIVIFSKFEGPTHKQCIMAYAGLDLLGKLQITEDTNDSWRLAVDRIRPATKKECDILFAKLKDEFYEWDACKKELKRSIKPKFKLHDIIMRGSNLYGMRTIMHVNNEKMTYGLSYGKDIPFSEQDSWHLANSHYFINNFKPFDKVLVRDDDNECWMPSLFGWVDRGLQDGIFVCGTSDWEQCIPFKGNEKLVGTTKPCAQEYVNW